jgi:hypothetical protein
MKAIQNSKDVEENKLQMLQKKELLLTIQIKEEECTTVRVIQKWVRINIYMYLCVCLV